MVDETKHNLQSECGSEALSRKRWLNEDRKQHSNCKKNFGIKPHV